MKNIQNNPSVRAALDAMHPRRAAVILGVIRATSVLIDRAPSKKARLFLEAELRELCQDICGLLPTDLRSLPPRLG